MLMYDSYEYSPFFEQRVRCKVYSVGNVDDPQFHVIPYCSKGHRLGLPSIHKSYLDAIKAINVLYGLEE